MLRLFSHHQGGVVMPIGHINHFYPIEERDNELSRSSYGIMESQQCNDLALH